MLYYVGRLYNQANDPSPAGHLTPAASWKLGTLAWRSLTRLSDKSMSISTSASLWLLNSFYRYTEERNKRLRAEGLGQFLKLADSAQFRYLVDDPWVDHVAFNAKLSVLSNGDDIKFLVLGAGWGGLLFAVHLIEAGFNTTFVLWMLRQTITRPLTGSSETDKMMIKNLIRRLAVRIFPTLFT
jgi:hypothetical protein